MQLKMFSVEIKEDETIEVCFSALLPPTDLDYVKDNFGKEMSLEDLISIFENS